MLPQPVDRHSATRIFAGIVVLGMAAALTYHGILHGLGFGFPWDTFLFNPIGRYDDWFTSVVPAATHNPYLTNRGGAYFPFAYIALLAGDVSSKILSLAIFKALAALLLGAGVFLFWRNSFSSDAPRPAFHLLLLLLIVFAGYPLWFGLDRGNIDLWIAGLCLIYAAELRTTRSWIGPVALGIAIALKGYPLAFILLGLRQRRYGETALTLAIAVGLTLFALSQFTSGVAASWAGFQLGQRNFWLENIIGSASLFGTSDPYNGVRAAAWIALHAKQQFLSAAPVEVVSDPQHLDPHRHAKFLQSVSGGGAMTGPRILAAKLYNLVTLFAAGLTTFFVLFVDSPRWRRVLAVALITILYPNLAGDYKLLILLPAIFTLLADADGSKAWRRAFWLTALLMIPKAYAYFYGLSVTMLLNPLLLLGLWLTALWDVPAWREGLRHFPKRIGWYLLRTGAVQR